MNSANDELKPRLQADMKAAMKAKDKARLGTIRLILAAIKQREVDERVSLDDSAIVAILDKMVKQRRESASQYRAGGREDLADQEEAEMEVIREYLPQPLTETEIDALIDAAIGETGAATVRDMGKVMALLKPRLQGRTDMAQVSERIKGLLQSP